jgi:hypothetical protein
MEKTHRLATEVTYQCLLCVSSAAITFNQMGDSRGLPATLSVKMAMTTETYMDRRLSVPLCMDNCSHHNTYKQEIPESYGCELRLATDISTTHSLINLFQIVLDQSLRLVLSRS